eukprot:Nk52_evm59s485 gene=Nk52_evmTU59s485
MPISGGSYTSMFSSTNSGTGASSYSAPPPLPTEAEMRRQHSHCVVGDRRYGKSGVRLVTVTKDASGRQLYREFRVQCLLSLSSTIDFTVGDNRDIVATDSVKNTISMLAQRLGVTTIEQFALDLGSHFTQTYTQVTRVEVEIEEYPWQRMTRDGIPHDHAFFGFRDCVRTCKMHLQKGAPPKLWAGFKDMKILKTTQTGFVGFVRDEYTTLPEVTDRIFRTTVTCEYRLDHPQRCAFDDIFRIVKDELLDEFAGPPKTGKYSPSVQNTLFLAASRVLRKCGNDVCSVMMNMPNQHVFAVDMKRHGMENKNEVFVAAEDPHGVIECTVNRADLNMISKL